MVPVFLAEASAVYPFTIHSSTIVIYSLFQIIWHFLKIHSNSKIMKNVINRIFLERIDLNILVYYKKVIENIYTIIFEKMLKVSTVVVEAKLDSLQNIRCNRIQVWTIISCSKLFHTFDDALHGLWTLESLSWIRLQRMF